MDMGFRSGNLGSLEGEVCFVSRGGFSAILSCVARGLRLRNYGSTQENPRSPPNSEVP